MNKSDTRPRPPRNGPGGARTEANGTSPKRPRTLQLACPVCGGPSSLRATHKIGDDGVLRWLFLCRSCGGGLPFLREVSEATSVPVRAFLDNPLALGAAKSDSAAPRIVRPLPTTRRLRRSRDRLHATPEALQWLGRDGRGLSWRSIRRFRIGLTDAGVILPVYDEGALRTVVTRSWPKSKTPKYMSAPGHGAWLYPGPPPEGRSAVLVAGMFDAILAHQVGLEHAVTTTCGTSLPSRLIDDLGERVERVYVLYDVGEAEAAERNAERLEDAGLDAVVARLPLRDNKADVADYITKHGADGADLRALLRRARKAT